MNAPAMITKKRLLLLPLLGILMLLLCGCDRDDALSFYTDKLPDGAEVCAVFCDASGQWHDAAELPELRTESKNLRNTSGLGMLEDTYGCEGRLWVRWRDTAVREPVMQLCKRYPGCRLELRDRQSGEILQRSETVPLMLPDKFACAKRMIYRTAENQVYYDALLPRTFCGLTVRGWTTGVFCAAMICIPVLLILLLCGDMQKQRRGKQIAAVLLTVPGVLFVMMYLLLKCLPYFNLYDTPLRAADFLCLLACLPNIVILILLRRKMQDPCLNGGTL